MKNSGKIIACLLATSVVLAGCQPNLLGMRQKENGGTAETASVSKGSQNALETAKRVAVSRQYSKMETVEELERLGFQTEEIEKAINQSM